MGLDQYMYLRSKDEEIAKEEEEYGLNEIAYWRKHSDLQGYMEKIYIERGGDEEFNLIPLELSKEDIENLKEYAIKELKKYKENEEEEIEHTRGFFFGESREKDWEHTIEVCENILSVVDFEKEKVVYDSWW